MMDLADWLLDMLRHPGLSPDRAALALALALGRVAGANRLDIDGLCRVARASQVAADRSRTWPEA